jgi:metal-responsive CopG/Arc/MetJ family transcriptional regulator
MNMNWRRKVLVNFQIKKYLYDELKKIAEKQGQTLSAILRQIVIEYIQKNKEVNHAREKNDSMDAECRVKSPNSTAGSESKSD